jgi:hypothetical protein
VGLGFGGVLKPCDFGVEGPQTTRERFLLVLALRATPSAAQRAGLGTCAALTDRNTLSPALYPEHNRKHDDQLV